MKQAMRMHFPNRADQMHQLVFDLVLLRCREIGDVGKSFFEPQSGAVVRVLVLYPKIRGSLIQSKLFSFRTGKPDI